jgi:hypothetical protein
MRKAHDEAGGKRLVRFQTCASKFGRIVGVSVFPNMDAYQKWWKTAQELNIQQYFDSGITLGFEPLT